MITRYKLFIIRSHLRENLSKKRCKIREIQIFTQTETDRPRDYKN